MHMCAQLAHLCSPYEMHIKYLGIPIACSLLDSLECDVCLCLLCILSVHVSSLQLPRRVLILQANLRVRNVVSDSRHAQASHTPVGQARYATNAICSYFVECLLVLHLPPLVAPPLFLLRPKRSVEQPQIQVITRTQTPQ